jgi:mTERF domain-containing protein
MLLRIDTNCLVPLAHHHAFPHKIEPPKNSVVPTLTLTTTSSCRECQFVIHYHNNDDDKTTRRRRSSNWQQQQQQRRRHCHSGTGETVPVSELELQEGRMAVSSFLQQMGVSVEESESIASNSPSYLNMLIEGVRDLEQLSSSMNVFNSNFNYKDKILHIASLKGDKGKLAYLESLGFTLSSSMNVARYISSSSHNNTLPSLINKVTSIKQLLFNHPHHDHDHDDNHQLLIKNIRLIMCHLSISIDEDMQHTFSFFEKVQAKRGGLNILASQDVAFRCFIESFPRILLLSLNNHISPILDFLQNIGIPADRIPNIILGFPPILLWNVPLLKTRVRALNQVSQFFRFVLYIYRNAM